MPQKWQTCGSQRPCRVRTLRSHTPSRPKSRARSSSSVRRCTSAWAARWSSTACSASSTPPCGSGWLAACTQHAAGVGWRSGSSAVAALAPSRAAASAPAAHRSARGWPGAAAGPSSASAAGLAHVTWPPVPACSRATGVAASRAAASSAGKGGGSVFIGRQKYERDGQVLARGRSSRRRHRGAKDGAQTPVGRPHIGLKRQP